MKRPVVCGRPWATRLAINRHDPFVVEGRDVEWATLGSTDLQRGEGSRFHAVGRLRDRLTKTSAADLPLRVGLRDGTVLEATVRVEPTRFPPAVVAALRTALGELSASFEDAGIFAEVEVALAATTSADGTALVLADVDRPDARMQVLYETLRKHLPPLLNNPLRVQRLEAGPVRAGRAAPSPKSLLARVMRGDRALVLAARRTEGGAPGDYRWLASVVRALGQHVGQQRRNRLRLDDGTDGADWWRRAARDVAAWSAHPELSQRAGLGQPSWILSRDLNGAAIMRALREGHLMARVAGCGVATGAARRVARVEVADDTHLYELWVLMSVVEVLRQNFGFRFEAGEPQRLRDYARHGPDGVHFAPVRLLRRLVGLDGRPLEVGCTVEHEPSIDGLRPDVALTVEASGQATLHLLDAKYSSKVTDNVLGTARRYAKTLPATSAFVALPESTAAMSTTARWLHRKYRSAYPTDLATADHRYGLTWGSVHASPTDGLLGIRQFVTIALQYHRTELRHVCGQCGVVLRLDDTSIVGDDAPGSRGRRLRAHADETNRQGKVTGDRLRYTCPRCAYTWDRHRCAQGHVLMKHGRLTPHHQLDGDDNVACTACGHAVRT